MYGYDVQFKKGNGVLTTPKSEYKIVIGEMPCPEEDTKDKKNKIPRVIKKIEALQSLPQTIDAGLTRIEIIAIVSSVGFLVSSLAFPWCNAEGLLAWAGRCFTQGLCIRCPRDPIPVFTYVFVFPFSSVATS